MLFGIFSLLLTSGCGDKSSPGGDPAHEHGGRESHDAPAEEGWEVEVSEESDHDHEGHGHDHEAPHGGTLIALGDHFAHLEIIHDATTGTITVYVLDGEAENPVRIEQEDLILEIHLVEVSKPGGSSEASTPIHLKAVANPLTGETVGDTSEFSGGDTYLAHISGFVATLQKISLLGSDLENVEIKYPEGNE
jgi:hypothetical protein